MNMTDPVSIQTAALAAVKARANGQAAFALVEAAMTRFEQDPEFHARVVLAVRAFRAAGSTGDLGVLALGAEVALHLDDLARQQDATAS